MISNSLPVSDELRKCFSHWAKCVVLLFTIADFMRLSVSYIYKIWRSSSSPELMGVTQVLIQLVSVREGSFYLPEFDDVCIKQFVYCICVS